MNADCRNIKSYPRLFLERVPSNAIDRSGSMALRTVVLLLAGDALTFLLASHVVDTNCLLAARRQMKPVNRFCSWGVQ
ncbi:hypothetical protein SynA1825c_02017 [Synechococcus sp. A18-25c]|nr:hypothetical protein SynA1825c_02017 [Synechococcus sp. A18-25c]